MLRCRTDLRKVFKTLNFKQAIVLIFSIFMVSDLYAYSFDQQSNGYDAYSMDYGLNLNKAEHSAHVVEKSSESTAHQTLLNWEGKPGLSFAWGWGIIALPFPVAYLEADYNFSNHIVAKLRGIPLVDANFLDITLEYNLMLGEYLS